MFSHHSALAGDRRGIVPSYGTSLPPEPSSRMPLCAHRLTNVPSTPASNVESQHDMEQAVPTEAERENPHPLLEIHDQQQHSSQQPRAVDMTLIIIVGCVLLTLGIAAGAAWYYRTRCADGHHVGSIRSTAIDDGTAAQAINALELELDDA